MYYEIMMAKNEERREMEQLEQEKVLFEKENSQELISYCGKNKPYHIINFVFFHFIFKFYFKKLFIFLFLTIFFFSNQIQWTL